MKEKGGNGGQAPSARKARSTRSKAKKGVKPVITGALTKDFLMGIGNGLFVASNVGYAPKEPVFAEYAAPMDQRKAQWEKITESGAQNRLCQVFESKDDYDAYMGPFLWDDLRRLS